MADNVTIDNADQSDFTAATDEVQVGGTQGVAHVQFVKLVDGTLNGTDPIQGTSANGIEVDVTRIAAGDSNIGNVDVVTLPSLPAGTNNIGDVDVVTLPALPAGTNNIGDVDVLSLPALPAGTNNIGDVDVLSLVPGTGATALGKAIDSAAGGTDTGVAALAIRDDALTTLTPVDGDYTPLRVSSTGALHVTGGGGGTEYNEGDVDATITGSVLMWEDTGDTLRPASVATPVPTNVVASDLATDDVQAGLVPFFDNAGTITKADGLSTSRTLSAASTNATSVKASMGKLHLVYAHSINAAVRYLKLYDKASAPTVGTDTPKLTFPIPAATTGNGFVLNTDIGIKFTNGIAFALTTGVADSDTGAVAANEIVVNLAYI